MYIVFVIGVTGYKRDQRTRSQGCPVEPPGLLWTWDLPNTISLLDSQFPGRESLVYHL